MWICITNGPDGSFVTGYSSPPVGDKNSNLELGLFDHLGSESCFIVIDGISGTSVVTVWQELEPP